MVIFYRPDLVIYGISQAFTNIPEYGIVNELHKLLTITLFNEEKNLFELFKNKQYRSLLICLTALDSVQLFILYVFWSWIFFTGTGIELEIAFIIYSAIITITLITVPLLIYKKHLLECHKTLNKINYISIGAAFVSSFVALLPGMTFLFISLSLITLFIFISHAICLMRVAREIPDRLIGRTVGIVVAVAMLLGYWGSILSYEWEDTSIIYISFTFLLAVAVFFFRPRSAASEEETVKQHDFSRRFVITCIVTIFLYALVAGLDDNIRFIVEVATDFEGVFNYHLVFLFGALIYLFAGYLVDKIKYSKYIILTCLITICAIFSLLILVDAEIMAYTYVFSSMLPIYTLWVVSIVLTIRLAKSLPHLAGSGYAMLYLGMIPTSVMFLIFPEANYRIAIALVLVFTVAALALTVYLFSVYERQSYISQLIMKKEELAMLTAGKSEKAIRDGQDIDYSKLASEFGLTPREGELFPLIISPLTANEIAEVENMAVATVKFHIGNILSKTSCKNRRALFILVEGSKKYMTK